MDGSQSEVQLTRGERERKEDLVCDQTGSVLIRESRLGKIDARGGVQVGEILGDVHGNLHRRRITVASARLRISRCSTEPLCFDLELLEVYL